MARSAGGGIFGPVGPSIGSSYNYSGKKKGTLSKKPKTRMKVDPSQPMASLMAIGRASEPKTYGVLKGKSSGSSSKTPVTHIYGSGSSSKSGSSYTPRTFSASGGYSRGGGYSGGGGGGGSASDPYLDFQKEQFSWEKEKYEQQRRDAELQRERELARARTEAKASLRSQLDLINRAINNARGDFREDRSDWRSREDQALGELSKIYGGLLTDTKGMNQAALSQLASNRTGAVDTGQSLIDAIEGRNTETEQDLSQALEQMGMGQALGVDQARSSEALSLAEMLSRGQLAQTESDFGMQRNAQRAVGDWNITGIKTDRQQGRQDVSRQVNDIVGELQRGLQDAIQEQRLRKQEVQGETDAFLRGLLELSGSTKNKKKKKK